ncbi:helix-turn-helix transcriptional regulator [Levilactobacillus tujiorum]|uniref:helix-turn-helix transcriptional regulator n=1 Tax=Levilactobacillus tujiorum TaxID=2912243 RepID=UPI001F11D1A5|nr:helix-turn-helix transcriptional regulator [Levilactobacillus tujiorum]MCH5465484.1 helix-turn-helix domain-containing protein [Levilactobacillus tujiorum]
MTLGENLKQTRTDHQLTQQAVAEQVNVSRQTISSWETGKSYPDIDSLVTLSNLYGLSLDILIKEDTGMLDYLRKSEVMENLRPIRQVMLGLNFLFLILLTFFLQNNAGEWVLIVAVLTNQAGFLYLQKFEGQLSTQPVWERRWRQGWLPTLVGNILVTLTLLGTQWWSVSPTVENNLVLLTQVGWVILLFLWLGRVLGRLKSQEEQLAKTNHKVD